MKTLYSLLLGGFVSFGAHAQSISDSIWRQAIYGGKIPYTTTLHGAFNAIDKESESLFVRNDFASRWRNISYTYPLIDDWRVGVRPTEFGYAAGIYYETGKHSMFNIGWQRNAYIRIGGRAIIYQMTW